MTIIGRCGAKREQEWRVADARMAGEDGLTLTFSRRGELFTTFMGRAEARQLAAALKEQSAWGEET